MLYKKSVDHKNAPLLDIQDAADLMSKLGSNYYDRAAVLYEKSGNIRKAADLMSKFGSNYYDRAAVLLKKHGLTK